MRFVLFFLTVFLVCIGTKAHTQTVSYRDAINRIAFAIEDKLTGNAPVAIIKFDSSSERFSSRVINDLTETLINDGIKVVDRQNIDLILAEQNFQLSGYVSDESAVSIGRMLGAQFIIVGSGENMADYYRVQFRMLSVETAAIQSSISQNIRYDTAMRRLLDTSVSDGVGSTRFAVGGRLGAGFGINTAHSDMVGTGVTPKEESNITFAGALFFEWRITDRFGIQPEINIAVNNGIIATFADGGQVSAAYHSLDIPLLLNFNIIHSPVLVRVFAGPYLAIPISKMNMEVAGLSGGTSADTTGVCFGVTGGFSAGFRVGPGNIIGDIRYMNDFSEVNVIFRGREMKGFLRRSVNITVGYELSL
jgi:TolB-like protein